MLRSTEKSSTMILWGSHDYISPLYER